MTDVQIKSFLTLAEEKSFTKASKRLCISQSTLSTHISSLEKNLGITLFDRTNKNVSLSAEGQLVYPVFRQAYEMIMESVAKAKILHSGQVNLLRIAFLSGLRSDMMARVMKTVDSFCEMKPDLDIRIMSMNDNEILDMLEKNELDLAFTFGRALDTKPELDGKMMLENHLCLLYPKERYGDKNPFSKNSIERESLIVVNKEVSPSEEAFFRDFKDKYGNRIARVMRVNSMEAKVFCVKTGYGVGFSDNMTRLAEPDTCGRYPLNDILIQYGFIYRKNTRNPLVKLFISCLPEKIFFVCDEEIQ